MVLYRHTRFLILLAVLVALVFSATATAQETTSSESDDVLTRYDSPQTVEMAAQYAADRAREEQLEAEIEALEEAGEYGPERDALREELLNIEDDTGLANQLGDSRYRDVQDVAVEGTRQEKIEELKRKAASLYALESWSDEAPIDINSSLYYWGAAEKKADEYRAEAEALEAAVVPEETVAKKTVEETTAGAPPGNGGGAGEDPEANPAPANEANEPGVSDGGLAGNTGGFSIISLLAAALIVLGVGYYVIGLVREGLGDRIKRVGSPQQARASEGKPKPRERPREAPPQRPRPVTEAREESRDGGGGEVPPRTSQGRVTPSAERETGSLDDKTLAEWFAQEMSEESGETQKEESRRSERRRKRRGEATESTEKVPEAQKDVNQMVTKEVTRMRAAGELGPEDEVEVRVVDGRIVVRKRSR